MTLYNKKFNPHTQKHQWVLDGSSVPALTFKDGVDTLGDLPSTGNETNDARLTNDTGHLYVWNGTSWIDQGDFIDLKWSAIENRPSSSVVNIDDAVSKKHTQNTDSGTTEQTFHIDSDNSGPKLKNDSGNLQARNSADNAFIDFDCKKLGDGTNKSDINNLQQSAITVEIDGDGEAIVTGIKGDVVVPFDCEITKVSLLADQSGSIVIDVWKDTYANFPPTDADSITSSAVPTISSATKSEDSTLTGWTKTITEDDILRFSVDSCTTITRCTLVLTVRKS